MHMNRVYLSSRVAYYLLQYGNNLVLVAYVIYASWSALVVGLLVKLTPNLQIVEQTKCLILFLYPWYS